MYNSLNEGQLVRNLSMFQFKFGQQNSYQFEFEFMEPTFVDKAIPMVQVNESSGKYVLTNEAINFFKAIKGPIAVVSVAGLYRTGKSYLLNRVLLSRSNGFGVGPTVNPCTKGLWCWGSPIKGMSAEGEPVNIIVIDTEGIGALDEDQTHDTKIFTLAILASSCFIYNSVGSIDENAIQNLSLVVNLTKHIQLKSEGMDEDGVDPDEVSNYFPSFYWVVRDFSLQLQDTEGKAISSREYLEKALAPQAGYTDDIEEKNRIRRLLTAFFKDRDCFTMIRPLVDEQKLQNLDKMSYDDLRPEFVHQVMNFRKKVTECVKIKTLQNQRLNGEMYCTMISSYVNSINEGAVPNIENAWNYMCEEQCQKALDDCYQLFIREMKEGLRDFPKSEEDFNKCINEAEEKAIEMFKQRALGDGSAEILRQLKKRIKQQIDEVRAQNIKQSNEEIRNYIMKLINPIKKKLNDHQYKGFPQFEKEVAALYERASSQGPKLHGHKLLYVEAFKKFTSQGAEYLFRDFTKKQEKENERAKEVEGKLQQALQEASQQIEKLQNQKRELDTSSYQTIHQLENKIDTLKTQLELMARDKEEEEKKMERQFTIKMQSQQTDKKDKEARINQYMEKLESTTRKFNEAQKAWEKDRAVYELKNQQQLKDLEQFSKKEKKWEAEQQLQVNEMSTKNKDMAQRYEREREELKGKLKEMEEKYNTTQEELSALKEQFEQKISKWEKKEKKLKDDLANIKKEHDNMKNIHEQEKMNLKEEIDNIKDESSKGSNTLQTKLKEAERINKELTEKAKKDRNMLEIQNEKLEQALKHMKEANEKLQEKNQFLVYDQERQRQDLEKQLCERGEEAIAHRLQQITQRHNIDMESLREKYENEKKEMEMNINNLVSSNTQLEDQTRLLKLEETKMRVEHQNALELLQIQLDNQKESSKTLESEKERDKLRIEHELRDTICQLESEIEEIKDKAEKERNEKFRETEQIISQMRNSYEIEKETNDKRHKNEVSKLKRKNEQYIQELTRGFQEEKENLQNENQDLIQKLMNTQEMLKNQSSAMQHEIDMKEKKVEELSKMLAEIRGQFETKEKQFRKKEQQMTTNFKAEKEKLETRIDKLTGDHHILEKQLMAVRQTNQQQKSNLDKRESKIQELESALSVQKEELTEQISKLHAKVTDMEKDYHEKTTSYEKENALLHQKNDFKDSKIADLEKIIHNSTKDFEERLSKYKEEKEQETNQILYKIREEKSVVDGKYQKLKVDSKEKEENLKKSLVELSTIKQTHLMKISTLESRCQELEAKKAAEYALMQTELTSYKSSYNELESRYEEEKRQADSRIEKLEGQLSDSTLKYQKEKSLLEQKFEFNEKSKNDTIEDLQQRINRLETLNGQMMESKNSEKSKAERNYYENMRLTESKYTQKISELTEALRREQNDRQLRLRDRDQEIKQLKEKYESEKMQKESSLKISEKKISQMSENEKRLKEENERLRTDKERRDLDYVKKQSQLKEKNKEKLNELENKVKFLQTEKNSSFISLEKERVKWNMEKQQIKDHMSEIEERLKKAERDKDKYKSDVERLKAERKNNNRTHSYISSLKTTYEPHKLQPKQKQVEQTNKENSQYQN